MGYKAAGEEGGSAGAKSKERRKDRSDKAIEEMSVSVNLVRAFCVKTVKDGGTRESDGSEEVASSRRPSAQNSGLGRSADSLSRHR